MFAHRLHVAWLLAGLMLFAVPAGPARAELMLDRVPDDAVLYLGWRGTAALGDAFENSHFRSMLHVTEAEQRLADLLPMAGAFLGEHEGQVLQTLAELESVLWERPWAIFVADATSAAEGPGPAPAVAPAHRLGLLVKPGPYAEQVRQALQPWERTMTDDATPATWVDDGEVLGLMVGYDERQVRDLRVMWRSLSRDTGFSAARRQVMDEPAVLAYVNPERLVRHLAAAAVLAETLAPAAFEPLAAGLGLGGMERVIYAGGFEKRMWRGQLFADAPAPRRGMVKLFDAEPVHDRDLRIVPRSATWVSAYRLDPAVALEAFMAALADAAGPGPAAGLSDARQALAAGLGDLWIFYSDPAFITPAGPGVCLVHPLRDPQAVQTALGQFLEAFDGPVEQVARRGMQIHRVALAEGVTLAWAIAADRLYVGTGADAIATAHAHALRPGNAVTQSSRFQRVRERLGEAGPGVRLTFADLQSTAPAMFLGYRHALAANGGAANPGPGLPDLQRLMPYLIPAGKLAWADERGWHSHSIGPFPGASLLSPCATINLGTGTVAALLFNMRTVVVTEP